jgi:hypothetical protein
MELTITETNETFDSWLEKDFVTPELKETLNAASILVVPFESLRDTPNPFLFPIVCDKEITQYAIHAVTLLAKSIMVKCAIE